MAEYLNKDGLRHFWDDIKGEIGNASDAQVDDWLDRHPEATTTVQDGAITTAKLADEAVTDAKLLQSGGVLSKVSGLNNALCFHADNFDGAEALIWEQGGLDSSTGIVINSASAKQYNTRTQFITVKSGEEYTFHNPTGKYLKVYTYKSDYSFNSADVVPKSANLTNKKTFASQTAYFRMTVVDANGVTVEQCKNVFYETDTGVFQQQTVKERTQTNGNYTDFNVITRNGVYLVNSALTNGHNGSGSSTYSGTLIVFTWSYDNGFGTVQAFISSTNAAYIRTKWQSSWTNWELYVINAKAFSEQVQTNGNYTDFNDIKSNGCYLVNSSLTHGPNGATSYSYSGALSTFTFNHSSSHAYGTIQLFVSSTNVGYLRTLWENAWTSWFKIASNDDVEEIFNWLSQVTKSTNILDPKTFIKRGYYYSFDDGETHVENLNVSTSEKIDISSNNGYLYIRQTFNNSSDSIILIYCYGRNDTYLGYDSVRYNAIQNGEYKLRLKYDTIKIIAFTNASSADGSMICLSLNPLDRFYNYGEKIELEIPRSDKNQLNGATICNFGDSIFGKKRPPKDISTNIANITGATVYNLGFGGCRMSQHSLSTYDPFSMYQLADAIVASKTQSSDIAYTLQIANATAQGMPDYFEETVDLLKTIDFTKVDIITIAYGTNDFAASVPLSVAGDEHKKDTDTYEGALRYSIEKIMTAYPQIKVFICTPIFRYWAEGGVIQSDSDTREIGGQKLTQFVSSCINIAREYHLTSIDNYYQLGMNRLNCTYWIPVNDGTHPNEYGTKLIAQHMTKFLF